MRKEKPYVVSRRVGYRLTTQNEYYISITKGSKTVGAVWRDDAVMKSAYDQRGRLILDSRPMAIHSTVPIPT